MAILSLHIVTALAENTESVFMEGLYRETALNDPDGAIAVYTKIVDQPADNRMIPAQALLRRGICYEKIGRKENAIQSFQAVLSRYPDQDQEGEQARAEIDRLTAGETEKARWKAKKVWEEIYDDHQESFTWDEIHNGIGVGLAGSVPLGDTGFFVYLGGGFMPFIANSNPDTPFAFEEITRNVRYLYNLEGGAGYYYNFTHFSLSALVGYRFQVERVKTTIKEVREIDNGDEEMDEGVEGEVEVDFEQDKQDWKQKGIIAAVRVTF